MATTIEGFKITGFHILPRPVYQQNRLPYVFGGTVIVDSKYPNNGKEIYITTQQHSYWTENGINHDGEFIVEMESIRNESLLLKIEQLTHYRFFSTYDSVAEIIQETPKMWGTKLEETRQWLFTKSIINEISKGK